MKVSITPIVLMPSHRIELAIQQMLHSRKLECDHHFAVMAALKMSASCYLGKSVAEVLDQLSGLTTNELNRLARSIHPVLCSLDLQKWMEGNGAVTYVAQGSHSRGQAGTCLALDQQGMEVPMVDTSTS